MTDLDLDTIEARANAATPGPWYPRATDDEWFMNARYVSTAPGPVGSDWKHDGNRGLCPEEAEHGSIVAITLLQQPRLADMDACDENTVFIAHARQDIPLLVAEIRKLRLELARLTSEGVSNP